MIENIYDNWDYLLSTCCSAPSSDRHYYNTCSKCMKKARFYNKLKYKQEGGYLNVEK